MGGVGTFMVAFVLGIEHVGYKVRIFIDLLLSEKLRVCENLNPK